MYIQEKQPVKFVSKAEKKGVLTTLGKIKKLLASPKRWMKDDWHNEEMTSFCLLGAKQHIDGDFEPQIAELFEFEAQSRGFDSVPEYNDDERRIHKHIVGFLDKCYKRASNGKVVATPNDAYTSYN